MKKLRTLAFAAAAAVVAATSLAHADAIEDRKAILKGWGDLTRPLGATLKGEAAFDLVATKAALAAYVEGTAKLPGLFPDNSKTGGKTEASPKIWSEKAQFEAGFAKLSEDAKAAQAAITDEASFKANIGKVLGNCKACHDSYREKK